MKRNDSSSRRLYGKKEDVLLCVPRRNSKAELAFHGLSPGGSHRRYSARIGVITLESPVQHFCNPSQPQTWDASWTAAFNKLQVDNEVFKEDLSELLVQVGHRHPEDSMVKSMAEKVTPHNGLGPVEVYDFIQRFQAELHMQIRKCFDDAAAKHGGKVPIAELEDLVSRRGYTPIPHSVCEVLKEAANDLHEDLGEGVSLRVFKKVNELLEQREGFCKSDLSILEGAFQKFDKDANGIIDRQELRPVLESLDFCLDAEVIKSIVDQQVNGNEIRALRWRDFLCISRKRVQLEFDLCQDLFQKCDDDEDGFLKPGEVMRMVSKLGVSLLPETLMDVADECGIDGGAVDFPSFWTMLQILRAREGFTLMEAARIHEVFQKFDTTGRQEMPLKQVTSALTWLGYIFGPGALGHAHKQIPMPDTGNCYMTEAQFLKLVRKHREAQLQTIRKVYRTFADDKGAGKIRMENLQPAVTRLNRLFVNDFADWMKTYRPAARIARKHISFDYEEFRLIVLHCCEKHLQKIQKNCGYSEVQLTKLRIDFVKFAKDGSSSEVDVPGLVKLFKVLFPHSQTSPAVRDRLKRAYEINNSAKNKGMDWHTLLKVLQTYDHLADAKAEECIEAALSMLCIPESNIAKAQELLAPLAHVDRIRFGGGVEPAERTQITGEHLQWLVQWINPGLTRYQADEALDRLREAEYAQGDDDFNAVVELKRIVLS